MAEKLPGVILFALALWLFPSLRKIFSKEDDSLCRSERRDETRRGFSVNAD